MTMLDAGVNASPVPGAEPVEGRRVIHTEHYNLALVRTVLTTEQIDARSILETASGEVAYQTLRERGKTEKWRGA